MFKVSVIHGTALSSGQTTEDDLDLFYRKDNNNLRDNKSADNKRIIKNPEIVKFKVTKKCPNVREIS
jgi:hypothetical protein